MSTFNVMLFLGIIQQQIGDLLSTLGVVEPMTPVAEKSTNRNKATPPSKTHSTLSSPMYVTSSVAKLCVLKIFSLLYFVEFRLLVKYLKKLKYMVDKKSLPSCC